MKIGPLDNCTFIYGIVKIRPFHLQYFESEFRRYLQFLSGYMGQEKVYRAQRTAIQAQLRPACYNLDR